MHLLQILRAVGPNIWDSKIKLVRHRDAKWDLPLLLRTGFFHVYEGHQGKEVFKGADYLLRFIAEGQTRSRFLGCMRIAGVGERMREPPSGFPYPEMPLGHIWYDLEPVAGFEDLEDRLVVDWGKGTRSWVQWLRKDRPRAVIEVLPVGHVGEFPGYDGLILAYDDLQRVIANPDANRAWHLALREVAGVYLITDVERGDLYVGSAYGQAGILGRWQAYARAPHGGNKLLRAALAVDSARHHHFRFSILRTLPRSMSAKEVIEMESLYKRKLGSRAHGLNAN